MKQPIALSAVVRSLGACTSLGMPGISAALVKAGARPVVAECTGQRMTDKLSITRPEKLKRAKALPGEKTSSLSAAEVVERVNRVGDSEVVAVIASAAAVCSAAS